MSFTFPVLGSTTDGLSEYCNFIEHEVFTSSQMGFDEFDLSELSLKDIKQELNRRLELYGKFKPYALCKNKVKSSLNKKEDFLHYYYCLYYAVKGGNSKVAETNIFEIITNVSLKNYFSTEHSIITSVGQNSTNLRGAIENIRVALCETKGSYDDMAIQAKDGGIDIVTYKPVDKRGNQMICLTDATIGRNWISQKKVASKLEYWKDYIHFKVKPMTCLSIVHIVQDSDFYKASRENGLVFDRARIMRYFSNDINLTSALKTWITNL